jgi:esterase/lipase superfamily enzyme
MSKPLVTVSIVLLCLCGEAGDAQSSFWIEGQVARPDGEVLAGVSLELLQNGVVIARTVTNESGRFSFPLTKFIDNLQLALPAFVSKFDLSLFQGPIERSVADVIVWVVVRPDLNKGKVDTVVWKNQYPKNPKDPTGKWTEYERVSVYYATDRARIASQVLSYGGDRNKTGRLELGRFDVSIPPDHRVTQIERPKNRAPEDPNRHFVIVQRVPQTYDQYYVELTNVVGGSPRKEVLVFVHGFNVSFESAIYRTAQLAYDLAFAGAAIAYSWPSEELFPRYLVDQNNGEWTISHLRWFLEDVGSKTGAQKIHLIAHSMGNRPLVNALNRIATERRSTPRPQFSQVIMTAPDIDADTFLQMADTIRGGGERVTLYASSNDLALKLSKVYQGYQRAGDSSPEIVIARGIDSIDVSAVDTSLAGHSYYGDNRSVLTDIFYLLREAKPPGERFGLRATAEGSRRWWVFKP